MSMSSIPSSSPGGKRYGWVEKIGNKVPHPFLLFILSYRGADRGHGDTFRLQRRGAEPYGWFTGGGQKSAQRGRVALVFAQRH